MKSMGAAFLVVGMSANLFADIIGNEPETRPADAQKVTSQLQSMGLPATESLSIASRLDPGQLKYFAEAGSCTMVVGALLPEEWIGAGLWFYSVAPGVEYNLRKYIWNDTSRNLHPVFDWSPWSF